MLRFLHDIPFMTYVYLPLGCSVDALEIMFIFLVVDENKTGKNENIRIPKSASNHLKLSHIVGTSKTCERNETNFDNFCTDL